MAERLSAKVNVDVYVRTHGKVREWGRGASGAVLGQTHGERS
jgi:hypothetical protein